jgi:hypothetical protein
MIQFFSFILKKLFNNQQKNVIFSCKKNIASLKSSSLLFTIKELDQIRVISLYKSSLILMSNKYFSLNTQKDKIFPLSLVFKIKSLIVFDC